MSDWNPSLYLHFAAERSRPAMELLARVRWRISNTLPILAVAQVTAPHCCINVGLLPE